MFNDLTANYKDKIKKWHISVHKSDSYKYIQ